MKYPHLFSPIKIGNLEIRNRYMIPSMCTTLQEEDGTVTDRSVDYWIARGQGGYGLCTIDYAAVSMEGRAMAHQNNLFDDKFIPGIKRLADAIHAGGAKASIQLNHAGRIAFPEVTGMQPVGPSVVPSPSWSPLPKPAPKTFPRELSIEEIHQIVEDYGDAALRAKKAGVDMVEVHGGHGYLVAQFVSPFSNKRFDEYGGDLEGRARIAVEIIRNIKEKCGDDFPVSYRMSVDEHIPGGATVQSSRMLARMLEEAGVDMINVTSGDTCTPHWTVAPACMEPGMNANDAAAIKEVVSVPVAVVGRINDPLLAEDIIASGKADIIVLGRESVADPEFPKKVQEGRFNEVTPCIACLQRCGMGGYNGDISLSCAMNPFTGKEGLWKIEPTETPKNIVVVGAGPGGLEAAWLLAKRGHKVTVLEREKQAGGQFRIASLPPHKQNIAKALKFLMTMCKKYGVEFRYNCEATEEMICAMKPDSVILATGGISLVPRGIEGTDGPNVVSCFDAIERKVAIGDHVLVVGGGIMGSETADMLCEDRHYVTMIEMLPEIANGVDDAIRYFFLERFKECGVKVLTGAKVQRLTDNGMVYEQNGVVNSIEGFDTIILAFGAKPYNPLEEPLRAKGLDVHVIGDAKKAGKAMDAIYQAAELAIKL